MRYLFVFYPKDSGLYGTLTNGSEFTRFLDSALITKEFLVKKPKVTSRHPETGLFARVFRKYSLSFVGKKGFAHFSQLKTTLIFSKLRAKTLDLLDQKHVAINAEFRERGVVPVWLDQMGGQ
jgi:hypothetical protein